MHAVTHPMIAIVQGAAAAASYGLDVYTAMYVNLVRSIFETANEQPTT